MISSVTKKKIFYLITVALILLSFISISSDCKSWSVLIKKEIKILVSLTLKMFDEMSNLCYIKVDARVVSGHPIRFEGGHDGLANSLLAFVLNDEMMFL